MRNSKTTKELYEKLLEMPDLHSVPELDGEILIWNLYAYAYIRAYCDSYDTCIEIIDALSGKSIVHWHSEEDDMFDELYSLGKKGNILVLRKSLFGTDVIYTGTLKNYPGILDKKHLFKKLIYLNQNIV